MDWIEGLARAIDYVEAHLTEEIDYAVAAGKAFSSSSHFQRVFGLLCGMTLGEYIRRRRLALAGAELARGECRVIDAALKYGYDSPDSFARAFRQFHGVNPSRACEAGTTLHSFSRLSVKLSLEGGDSMDYRIEKKTGMTFMGYKRRFAGDPGERSRQEADFFLSTRGRQYLLQGWQRDTETQYTIMNHFGDDGYDFYIAGLPAQHTAPLDTLGEGAPAFEQITVPPGLWLVCETERCRYPSMEQEALRRRALSKWLPSSGLRLDDRPEVNRIHWYLEPRREERYIELWLPVCPV